jgi:hypothetical protein
MHESAPTDKQPNFIEHLKTAGSHLVGAFQNRIEALKHPLPVYAAVGALAIGAGVEARALLNAEPAVASTTTKPASPSRVMRSFTDYYSAQILSGEGYDSVVGVMGDISTMSIGSHRFKITGHCNTSPHAKRLTNVQVVKDTMRGHYEKTCEKNKNGTYKTIFIPRSRFGATEESRHMNFAPGLMQAGALAAQSVGLPPEEYGAANSLYATVDKKHHISDVNITYRQVSNSPALKALRIHLANGVSTVHKALYP